MYIGGAAGFLIQAIIGALGMGAILIVVYRERVKLWFKRFGRRTRGASGTRQDK